MRSVEEINVRTYNPNIYFSSLNQTHQSARVSKQSQTSARNKRVNYSLADLEAKIYNQPKGSDKDDINQLTGSDKHALPDLLRSNKRFMELDTENYQDLREVTTLLSNITGLNKDKIDQTSTGILSEQQSGSGSSRQRMAKFDLPKSMNLLYKSSKPPRKSKKSSNRISALRKVLSSRRSLHSYLETLDQVNHTLIYSNVQNKKFFRVLPMIVTCSMCGGYSSISNCVVCNDKICSLRCYELHSETRCNN
ncbi:Vps71p [Kluyveromyces lactis]|uniref:KLLA0A02145p n=1 Tax=Kluyveromyces lactis (strain ATCC 8585 / CBS 2359 / DSM 70799 / NBRC 1267 / NRRL Y-1140 / WM37) TaxID=284590 RepID=Q6CY94_KLULA|nr:uncharacterized protein KLLA0_A02145g [Kluyveromyces lactis]CAH02683.1 KLLA0A02145p [Kluyveromyces lactis]|eukprot:XP_451095.1 uncharacterized protein KLLA0_A02145g [Kluyveromyces lactis]